MRIGPERPGMASRQTPNMTAEDVNDVADDDATFTIALEDAAASGVSLPADVIAVIRNQPWYALPVGQAAAIPVPVNPADYADAAGCRSNTAHEVLKAVRDALRYQGIAGPDGYVVGTKRTTLDGDTCTVRVVWKNAKK
jgi:hypothetical protein